MILLVPERSQERFKINVFQKMLPTWLSEIRSHSSQQRVSGMVEDRNGMLRSMDVSYLHIPTTANRWRLGSHRSLLAGATKLRGMSRIPFALQNLCPSFSEFCKSCVKVQGPSTGSIYGLNSAFRDISNLQSVGVGPRDFTLSWNGPVDPDIPVIDHSAGPGRLGKATKKNK